MQIFLSVLLLLILICKHVDMIIPSCLQLEMWVLEPPDLL